MPVYIDENGAVEYALDLQNEIDLPAQQGRYLEAIARLDAHIDALLDAVVRKTFAESTNHGLLDAVEKAMRKEYVFLSGYVKIDILRNAPSASKTLSEELTHDLREFKTRRNKTLHSPLGYHNLAPTRANDTIFQKEAHEEVEKTVALGKSCHQRLEELLEN